MVVGQLLITPTVEICIQRLRRAEEMVWLPYDAMRIFSMRWATAWRGSVSGSGDSCIRMMLVSATITTTTTINVQSSLAKGRIAELPSLAPVNGFVRCWPHHVVRCFWRPTMSADNIGRHCRTSVLARLSWALWSPAFATAWVQTILATNERLCYDTYG